MLLVFILPLSPLCSIDNLFESGIIQRWTKEYTAKYGCQSMNSDSNAPSLTESIETVSGAFLILGIGVGLSVLTFGMEFLISRWKKAKMTQKASRRGSTRRPSEISPYSGRVVTTALAPRVSADLGMCDCEPWAVPRS